MVKKIAIIALVAVLAIPILLGYGLNLTETTETDYRETGESVNVTQLLQNDVYYNYAHGDLYQNNSYFAEGPASVFSYSQYPFYNTITTAKTSMKGNIAYESGNNVLGSSGAVDTYSLLYYQADYKPSIGSVTMTFNTYLNGVYTPVSVANFHSANYDYDTSQWKVTHYTSDTAITSTTYNDFHSVVGFTQTAGYDGFMYVVYSDLNESYYIDLSAGFTFKSNYQNSITNLPNYTHSILFTVNLDSITNANYLLRFSALGGSDMLIKSTINGQVHWYLRNYNDPSISRELYYNPAIPDNTYQFRVTADKLSYDGTYYYYDDQIEARYVGTWPKLVGEANAYQVYSYNYTTTRTSDSRGSLDLYASTSEYPIMRIDDTLFSSFEYPVMSDQQYAPADFKTNPETTISNVTHYGTSLQFGGNTYTVTNGKIYISGRDIPVKDLKLSSIPNGNGTYDNRIGKTVVSTTAAPSTITFDGIWAASVSTQSMESYTYTHTEWIAGSFAWDGMDQNFLMVGLITCLGVFVVLGVYARRSRSGGIIPLTIVTGCAAAVFFIMI